MKKIFKYLLIFISLGIFVGSLYYLYQKEQKAPAVFETQVPELRNIIKKTVATGSIKPRKEIEIKPQVSGIIQEIYVEAGKYVKKGDLLAKVKVIPNMINLNNAESRVERAKITLEDANLAYERQKKLFDKNVIAEAAMQPYELSLKSAKEELNSAENNLQLIKEGVSKKQGKITNTLVRSTISGMVLAVPIEIGNSVIESNTFNAGTTIATIANMGDMIFVGKVDETEVGKIHENMNLLLTVGAIENTVFKATLEYISPKGVEENGAIQFEIKANVQLVDSVFIRAGYSANADIVLARKDSVISIEESLLKFEKNSDSVYVEVETDAQEFEKRYVELGLSDGIHVEVLNGLSESDKIKAGEQKDEKPDSSS